MFEDLPDAALDAIARRFARNPNLNAGPVPESIRGFARVSSVVRSLIAEGSSAHLVSPPPSSALQLSITGEPRADQPEIKWSTPLDPKRVRTPFRIEFESYNSVYWLPIVRVRYANGQWIGQFSNWMQRTRHYRTRRLRVTGKRISISFRHPLLPAEFEGRVLELTNHRLAVAMGLENPLVWPGLYLDVWVSMPQQNGASGDRSFALRAKVLAAHYPSTFELQLIRPPEAWLDFVDHTAHPSIERHRVVSPDALWGLYADAGYFALADTKQIDQFVQIRNRFESVFHQLGDAEEVGQHYVWRNGDQVDAAVSVFQIYQGAWLAFQLAKRPGVARRGISRRKILRDLLIRMLEHTLHHTAQWHLATFRRERTLARTTYLEFAKRYFDPALASITPHEVWELPIPALNHLPVTRLVWEAPPRQERRCAKIAETCFPSSFAQAHDLVAARIGMHGIAERWKHAGLSRGRTILAAGIHRDTPTTFAILEWCSEGAHLFGLLDTVRLMSVGAPDVDAQWALLVQAAKHFTSRGKHRFVVPEVHGHSVHLPPGAVHLGTADMVELAGKILPDFIEQIIETRRRSLNLGPGLAVGAVWAGVSTCPNSTCILVGSPQSLI